MSEQENRNFENIQRVLSDTSSVQIALMTLTITLQSAGIVGLYSVAEKFKNSREAIGLPLVMVVISFILGFVWLREHVMAEAFRKQLLKNFHVWEPEKSVWNGKTALMWKFIHGICILGWLTIFILAIFGCLAKVL